jgi:hypothetical protein
MVRLPGVPAAAAFLALSLNLIKGTSAATNLEKVNFYAA